MSEERKKLSLSSELDMILSNNCVNTQVKEYNFYKMETLIINDNEYNIIDCHVKIILYLDELIIEIKKGEDFKSYTLPYIFVKSFYIIGGNKK